MISQFSACPSPSLRPNISLAYTVVYTKGTYLKSQEPKVKCSPWHWHTYIGLRRPVASPRKKLAPPSMPLWILCY